MLFIAAAMAISNVFAQEFTVFYLYVSIGAYVALFAPDAFPILPMFCCGYMLFSSGNNPNSHYAATVFSTPAGKTQFIAIACFAALVLCVRLITDLFFIRRKHPLPSLSLGFLVLGVAYLLSGVGSGHYGRRTALFGGLEILSLCFTYFYFYFTVDWSQRKPSDGAAILTAVGIGMAIEILAMYLTPDVRQAIAENTFNRGLLTSGWGVYNNVGGMMVMLMPAPLYFACTKKRGWLYILLCSVLMGAVVFSQSRGAILTGIAIYLLGGVFVYLYTHGRQRLQSIATYGGVLLLAGILLFLLYYTQNENHIFSSLFSRGLDSNDRIRIYKFGWEQFQEAPLFGNGFYSNLKGNVPIFSEELLPEDYFLPPRYHNTAVQLIACGGSFALLCYLLHRVETIFVLARNPAPHKMILALSVLALLISSLVDCHFFNFGPGLTYGMLLVCAERLPKSSPFLLDKHL